MTEPKIILPLILLTATGAFAQAEDKTLFFISDSHLDTQWNWDVKNTIDEYVRKTMVDNFALFEKYPAFMLNFEGAIRYKWMKEYYPAQYETLKKYIADGRWHVSGCSVDANDVMVSSAESIMRNWLYGHTFFSEEFGVRGGYDIMLPDCFGFSYALPSLAKHCGMKGFHTAKLAWGSAQYDRLAPWGIWQGVDGSQIFAIYKPHPYDSHEEYNKDNSRESWAENAARENYERYGLAAEVRYVGPRSDRGGALGDDPSSDGNNTPYWLNYSVNSDGPVKVRMASPDEIFDYFASNDHSRFQVYDGELPMRVHGVGSYSSQSMLKRWNRRNELLADAAEKASAAAEWLGVADYPRAALRDAWMNNLWQAHHDGITGTSIPKAYIYSQNEYVMANKAFADAFETAVGATARCLDTQVEGTAAVVYNPLSFERTDVAEAQLPCAARPDGVRVFDKDGREVLAQVTGYDAAEGMATVIFAATVPSLGYAVYDVRLGEQCTLTSGLTADLASRQISNGRYRTTLDSKGDCNLYDVVNKRLLMSAPSMQMLDDESTTWPAWEITYNTVSGTPVATVNENVEITLAEDGPLRKSFRVQRTKAGSTFVHYVRMSAVSDRVDMVNEVDWQTRETLLKLAMTTRSTFSKVTYDISLGTIERSVNTSSLYEMQGHQWADMTGDNGLYGVSVINDSKYGWDMPEKSNLRLTLIHTPRVGSGYAYQGFQDLGVHHFTVSFFPHEGPWSQLTQMEASKVNQPLTVFRAPRHAGSLGREFSFAALNSDAVSVKALKKAEQSDETIVRLYEWTGADHTGLTLTFPADIISAREVNGLEEALEGAAPLSVDGRSIRFDIGRYQPRTFAVRLAAPEASAVPDASVSRHVALDYNSDMMSWNSMRSNGDHDLAFPAELIPDVLDADGVTFAFGDRTNHADNVVLCKGQTVALDRSDDCRKLYILAASLDKDGSKGVFRAGDSEFTLAVPYVSGYVGSAETQFNEGASYRHDEVALKATHSHNTRTAKDEIYNFLYIYKYLIELPDDAAELTLPDDDSLCVFAMTLSDNENDDTRAATEVRVYHDYRELGATAGSEDFGSYLVPDRITVSGKVNDSEDGRFAADGDSSTKWCCTSSNSWLEYAFDEPVTVLRWSLLNAGCEGLDKISRRFKVQYHDGSSWKDIDVVTDNTANRVSRTVGAVQATRFRLQVNEGEQGGATARIYEFSLYGRRASESGISTVAAPAGSRTITLAGNAPNPCSDFTTVSFSAPEALSDVTMHVYDLTGRHAATVALDAQPARGGLWSAPCTLTLSSGCYIYTLEAVGETGARLTSDASRLIIR